MGYVHWGDVAIDAVAFCVVAVFATAVFFCSHVYYSAVTTKNDFFISIFSYNDRRF